MAKKNEKDSQPAQASKGENIQRRYKVVSVSPVVLEDWLKQDSLIQYKVVKNGLPKDAKLDGIRYDPFLGIVDLLYHSKEFPPVKDGEVPPKLEPVLKNLAIAKLAEDKK